MRIMWIVNTIFPYPAEKMGLSKTVFGGWLISLYESLSKKNIGEICIVSTYNGKDLKKYSDKNTIYYLIPNKYENKPDYSTKKYWDKIIKEFTPDIIHIHGTEYPKTIPLIMNHHNENYVVSIQGFLNSYKRVCYCNLNPIVFLKNITIRDILKPKTGYMVGLDYEKRAKYEKMIIENVDNVIGRTEWDYAQVKAINPEINYYHGDENLRECFYKDKWNIEKIERHTIFFSQSQAILKGFYIMVEAINILKKKYPDIKVKVAGNNILDTNTIKKKLKRQSYTRYLQKLIKQYNIQDNIQYTGFLDAEAYKNELIKSHVYVQAASIENSSNSLGEAMILGVPCVASNVGGTSTMLKDKEEGFLYPYTEPELLAIYIEKYFESDELCKKYSGNARKTALKRHDWKKNTDEVINAYISIIKNKR